MAQMLAGRNMKKIFLLLISTVLELLICGCQATYPDTAQDYYQLIKDQPIELYSDVSGYDYVPMQDGKRYILEQYYSDFQTPVTFEFEGKKFTAWVLINHRWYQERKEKQRFVSTLLIFHGDQLVYKKEIFETLYGVPHSVRLKMPEPGVFLADIAPVPTGDTAENLKYLNKNFPQQTFVAIDVLREAQKSDHEFYSSPKEIDQYTKSLKKNDANDFFAELSENDALVFQFENVNYLLIPFKSCGTGEFLLLYKGKSLIRCWHVPDKATVEKVKVRDNQLTLYYRMGKSETQKKPLLDFDTLRFDYISKYPGLYLPNNASR